LTDRIKALPLDERGYPVPYFVAYIDGKPDFRVADGAKLESVRPGQALLGVRPAAGPLPGLCHRADVRHQPEPRPNRRRTSTAPEWSVKGCPFLSRPNMVRREAGMPDGEEIRQPAGVMIERNPGAICIWVTHEFKLFPDRDNRPLIRIGEPIEVSWWCQGRTATRAEVQESIDSGLPKLQEMCGSLGEREALARSVRAVVRLLPKA